ncbi:hypothetical protein [Undibacterium sp.]|uniref:hypothetical protein n=1 Tax=Undibacterium sp. TaxID=1914977 RepID=UPI00272F6287|nr:hypothetical protein [Undibacterium sp.]MDP1980472.1 hypothetical protein [Undibacterium sp.]
MSAVLELKIKNLVEGLEDVAALQKKIAELEQSSGKADTGMSVLSSGMSFVKDNVIALVGAFASLAIAYGIKESTEYAARTETLGITLDVVAKNAGYGAQEISKYEKEVKALGITTQGTREAITQMIQSGLEIGPQAENQVSQVAKLARAAQDLAVVTGENSSETLTKLITNISQLDTVGLRYMGLTVNVEAAERQFALSIGKTVEQLTQKQKIQAVMDESLKQAEKLQGAYGASMDSVGKKVQSLKRYQEELANDIGNKLLPAYGSLVDAATNFLKSADKIAQGIDKSGAASRLFAEGVSSFGSAMGDSLNTVMGMFGEIYPSLGALGKGFMELLGFVIRVGTEILTLGHYTTATGEKVTVLGQIVKFLIGAIALAMAGIKDGIDIATAAIFGFGGATLDIVGKIISGFGKLVFYINQDWGKAIQGVGDGLQDTGKDMIGFADKTVDQFARGETAVLKYRQSLRDAAVYQQKLAEVTDFSKAEAEVLAMAEAVRKNGAYTTDLATQSSLLSDKLKEMQASGALTTEQLGQLQKRLAALAGDDTKKFITAIDEAGLKLTQLDGKDRLTSLNAEFAAIVGTVQTLGNSTKTTADVMNDAFSKGVDAAKTLAELNQIGASLGDVKKVTGDIKPALVDVGIKFDELFEKALKAAKTEGNFADLRAEVQRLGKEGTISGSAVARALKDIEEKSKGAEAAMSRLAKQASDLAKSNSDVAKSHLELVKAQADVGRANLEVLVKQNEYRKSGSELAKEELNLAKINKQLAVEKATEAKLAYQVAVDAQKLLISLQQKLNADKELELHIGQQDADVYKDKAKAAEDAAKAAEDAVNWSRSELSGQQAIVSQVEEKKVKQEFARDIVKETGVAYELNRAAVEQINSSTGAVAQTQVKVTDKVNETKAAIGSLKSEIDKADGAAGNLITNFDKAARAAGNVKTPSQNTADTPARPRDPAPQSPNIDRGGQGNSNVQKPIDRSEKQPGIASDGFGGGAMDSDVANMLYDAEHGKRIEPTAENKQRAQTAWNAAKANKQMYDANSTAFSSAGADSILRSYNRAKTLAESMGLNTSESGSAGLNDGSGGYGGFAAPGSNGAYYRKLDGSHETGLDRVPKDGYVAELHKDEKVLTAAEADSYRKAPSVADLSRQLLSQISFPRITDDPAIKELVQQSARTASNQGPEKVIQFDLTGGGKTIPVTTDAGNERALLDLLKRAKGVAS